MGDVAWPPPPYDTAIKGDSDVRQEEAEGARRAKVLTALAFVALCLSILLLPINAALFYALTH